MIDFIINPISTLSGLILHILLLAKNNLHIIIPGFFGVIICVLIIQDTICMFKSIKKNVTVKK